MDTHLAGVQVSTCPVLSCPCGCPQVEKSPVVVKTSVSKGDAEAMKKQLEAGRWQKLSRPQGCCWLTRGTEK